MTSSINTRILGNSSVTISELGMGGAPFGDLFDSLSEQAVQDTLQKAWEIGIRYFDTAPYYGYGKSEHRIGTFLRQQNRGDFTLSSKAGRVLRATHDLEHFDGGFWKGGLPFDIEFDYSYDGIMRSYEDSLQRLSLPSLDLLIIHDLDFLFHKTEARIQAYLSELSTSGWRALEQLKRHGLIRGVGAGINQAEMIPRFLDMVDLDFFLVAMPYTLLDQSVLDHEFPLCAEHNIGIVIGAVFASGILATGSVAGARYAYETATPDILAKTKKIEAVCNRHAVPLPAAAMQFPLAHPLVASIIPGALSPEQISMNTDLFHYPIPSEFWTELKEHRLLHENAPVPGS